MYRVKRVANDGQIIRAGGHFPAADYDAAWDQAQQLLGIWPAAQIWCDRRLAVEVFANQNWAAAIGKRRAERVGVKT